ncbi:hypothetical protein MCOR25_007862 [Pyricularia grisea]|uniref:Fungal lipase-like domain-containing protein n=1 Tax=Pyricularia grisea TaxID=148305 RepID=A0A6P8AMJ9_PYRGI|nr:uncharacterized protein PgNI_12455 [Pyricularia grisea]KAI6356767.1 hypothetical protein MCOR25_007862 [Pyricularia grisea]TLD03263.1 hypothetical protein PgNI_12455 [Pyricularia grisea]
MKVSFVSSILALPLLAAAAPKPEAAELSSRDVTVTQQELNGFMYVRQLASAAYCNAKDSLVGKKVTCSNNACPDITAGNVVNYAHMDTDIGVKADGAVFIDHDRAGIIMSFMGSKSWQSFLTDLDFTGSDSPEICSGCEVHYGIKLTYDIIESQLMTALASARAQWPSYQIVATGHSMGAGVATVAAARLRNRLNVVIHLYTYGSPRVGNDAFATFVTNQNMGKNYRITHYDDVVAALPPSWAGFAHVSPEYWLRRKDASDFNYPLSEVVVCEGIKPSGCRNSMGTTLSGAAHGEYFGKISACY